jgi:hypothetical protein
MIQDAGRKINGHENELPVIILSLIYIVTVVARRSVVLGSGCKNH